MYKILLENGKFCTGCGACANACPTEVIEMKNDEYGFPQAVINKDKCIQCNVCKSICPVLKEKIEEYTDKPQCKAVMAENKIRFRSSSGGAFYVFAKNVLQQGGLVAGAALEDRTCRVKHILVSKVEELAQLQKSKYTQSEIGNIYKEIEHHLKDEKKILFTGCPCQVAGLKSYLKKEYENLLLVDIICHGVPSQKC